jgi:hypothetical protein
MDKLKQYIIQYKPNGAIIGWYCTKEAALDRLDFLSDTNFFGVFEVDVTIYGEHPPLSTYPPTGDILAMFKCPMTENLSVLNLVTSFADAVIKYTIFEKTNPVLYVDCYIDIGKQHKRPKVEEEPDF